MKIDFSFMKSISNVGNCGTVWSWYSSHAMRDLRDGIPGMSMETSPVYRNSSPDIEVSVGEIHVVDFDDFFLFCIFIKIRFYKSVYPNHH